MINTAYQSNHITTHKCIKVTHCTPQIYIRLYIKFIQEKEKEKNSSHITTTTTTSYRALTMCQALCFTDTVTNALGNLTEQAIIHPFYRYQGSDSLNNLPKKQMPLLFASKPVLDLLVTLINKLKNVCAVHSYHPSENP